MKEFDLSNFIVSRTELKPEWVVEENWTSEFYDQLKIEAENIKFLIESSNPSELKIKQKKIVISKVCKTINISSSNIREDRVPEIFDFIEKINRQLEAVYKLYRRN